MLFSCPFFGLLNVCADADSLFKSGTESLLTQKRLVVIAHSKAQEKHCRRNRPAKRVETLAARKRVGSARYHLMVFKALAFIQLPFVLFRVARHRKATTTQKTLKSVTLQQQPTSCVWLFGLVLVVPSPFFLPQNKRDPYIFSFSLCLNVQCYRSVRHTHAAAQRFIFAFWNSQSRTVFTWVALFYFLFFPTTTKKGGSRQSCRLGRTVWTTAVYSNNIRHIHRVYCCAGWHPKKKERKKKHTFRTASAAIQTAVCLNKSSSTAA